MRQAININELIEALDLQSEFLIFFLDEKTGEILTLTDEEVASGKKGKVDPLSYEIMTSERYIRLPELDKKKMMMEFALDLDDQEIREELLVGIDDEGAFARFNVAAHMHQLEGLWLPFIQKKLKDVAIGFCVKHNIRYVDKKEDIDWL
jgi:hypothetical protein